MKKLFFILLFVASATLGQAQVKEMLGQWYTIDDRTGEQRSCISITENNGTYEGLVLAIYDKDEQGNYREMKPPYPKQWEHIVGSQVFIDMKVEGDHLRGKVYDPESGKTYFGKVTYKAKTDELVLRGSLDKAGLLGRSQTWKRKK